MGPRPMPASTCKKKLLPLLLTQLCIRTLQPPAVCSSCYCHTWPWEQPQQCSLHQTTSGGCAAVAAAPLLLLAVAAAAAWRDNSSTSLVLQPLLLALLPSQQCV